MTLRRRLALVVGTCVGLAMALAATVAYLAVRSELRDQVDSQLTDDARGMAQIADARLGEGPVMAPLPGLAAAATGRPAFVRIVAPDGNVLLDRAPTPSPIIGLDSPPEAPEGLEIHDEGEGEAHVRVATAPLDNGAVLQVARSLRSVDETLANLRTVLFLVVMAGAVLGALAARVIADRMLRPVADLTEAAEHVSQTEDLSRRIEIDGDDEVAALGRRFNTMLERLEGSRRELDRAHDEQRQLIADASHELRTPVTALRTNIELIAAGKLRGGDRERSVAAAAAQAEELGALIGDLMDLARGEAPEPQEEAVRLDLIAGEAVERARLHSPDSRFELETEPVIVQGSPERLARAINNLLDNAAAHGAGGRVEVRVGASGVTVRDHGPGIAPGDEERIFDRFYRGQGARRRPGGGLGLAIVRQVAEAHHGSVTARNAPGGGAEFSLRLRTTTD